MTRHCCVLMSPSGRCRLVHIGKALQDQQWLFESLAVQLDERRASVENTAKQVEDRSVEIPGTNKTNPLGGTLTNCFKVKSFLSPLDWKLDRSDKDGDCILQLISSFLLSCSGIVGTTMAADRYEIPSTAVNLKLVL